jgi:hypothetical protein
MNTQQDLTGLPPDLVEDSAAVMAQLIDGVPLDPRIRLRIRERALRIKEEIRRRHGLLDIAVPSIREVRDR